MNNPSILCTLRLAHTDLVMQNHRVHDVSVMPGVVFLDLTARVLEARGHAWTGYALERVLFSEPVVTSADGDRELRVRIWLPEGDPGSVLVDSRVWGDDGAFVENMRAALVVDRDPPVPALDAAVLKARMTNVLDMSEMYRRARLERIDHRAPMRCTGSLWKGGGALLGELRLEVPPEPGFHMHPAALDAATIAAYAQTEAAFDAPFIPVSIDRVRLVAPLSEQFFLHAPGTEVLAATGDLISNDYDLYDRDGRHCASFRRLACKRIRQPDLITRLLLPRGQATGDARSADAPAPTAGLARAESYATLLRIWIAEILAIEPASVATHVGFYELGLGSRDLLALATRLEQVVGHEIYPTLLFEHRDIAALDAHLLASFGPLTAHTAAEPVKPAPAAAPVVAQTGFAAPAWIPDPRRPASPGAARIAVHGLTAHAFDSLRDAARERHGVDVIALDDPASLAARGDGAPDALVWFGDRDDTPDVQLAALVRWTTACHHGARPIELLVVERGETASATLHGFAAFLRGVRVESPRIAARALLVPERGWQHAVLDELARAGDPFPATAGLVAALPDGSSRVRALVPRTVATGDAGAHTPVLPDGAVCVIAGGAGGIGVQLAHWLATQARARVIVLARSEPDVAQRAEWARTPAPASIEHERCDVTDRARLDAVLDGIRQRFGRIDAVFHVAGVQSDALHFTVSPEACRAVTGAKVAGFRILDEATARDRLTLFCAFSSLAAWRPNPGQGVYAFANSALEALAERRRLDPTRSGTTVALAWPLWADGGMRLSGADLDEAMARTGLHPLPSADAFACLQAALRPRREEATLAVLHGDAARYRDWLSREHGDGDGVDDAVPPGRADEIAIVGLAGRYPGAEDVDAFWMRLRDGHDAITEVPRERWDHAALFDPQRGVEGRTYGRWGGFLGDIEGFDATLFQMSRREAERADPQERLFLETCWTLLEAAGHPAGALTDRNVGVFAGVMWNHYQLCGAPDQVAPAAMHASVANRVSYALDLRGPSMAVDTACSSSLTAIGLAIDALRGGACTMAIAGGVNLAVHPQKYLQLAQGQFLSDDGRCRSFGAGGNGYVPGEGVGAVLLRPLRDALRDGDHVWGVIRGHALNHAGRTSGFTVPSPAGQAEVMSRALRDAGIDGASVSYVEAHGTGTALGDPIEIESVGRVLGRDGGATLPIGSVKSNVGHLESAAGIAALTKVLLMARARQLAPSLHSSELNGAARMAQFGLHVQQALAPWQPSAGAPRRAAVSAFGAGGANAHLIIDEPPVHPAAAEPAGEGAQWLVLSARDAAGLRDYAERMAQALDAAPAHTGPDALAIAAGLVGVPATDLGPDETPRSLGIEGADLQALVRRLGREIDPDAPLAGAGGGGRHPLRLVDIACTLQAHRSHLTHRIACRAASLGDAVALLRAYVRGEVVAGVLTGTAAADVAAAAPPVAVDAGPVEHWVAGHDVDLAAPWAGARARRVALPVPRLLHSHGFWVGRWQREGAAQAPATLPAPQHSESTGHSNMIDVAGGDPVTLKVLANGVALVRMQAVADNNMFTQALLDGLTAAFGAIEADPAVRAVVLTGTDKVFSMGGTPSALERLARKEGSFTDVPFLYEGLPRCRVPVIAALRGHAAGGGLTFGLHADHVVLDRDGTYSANFVKFGFTPGLGATYALERRFGAALAAEMCMTAAAYAGRDLEAMGVALRFADGPQVLQSALRIADAIAEQSAPVVNALKRELAERTGADLAKVIAREAAMHDAVLHADLVSGIRARTGHAGPDTARTDGPAHAAQPAPAAPRVTAADPVKPRIRNEIETTLCRNLFVHRNELDARRTFAEMGLDSLGAVEIVRDLNHAFGLNLDSVLVYDHPTIDALVDHVAAAQAARDGVMAIALDVPAQPAAAPREGGDAAREAVAMPLSLASAVAAASPSRASVEVRPTANLTSPAPSSPSPLRLKLAPTAGAALPDRPAMDATRGAGEPETAASGAAPGEAEPDTAETGPPPATAADDDIAIIGLSARYPGATTAEALWRNLLDGTFSVEEISPERWDSARFYDPDPTAPGKTSSKVAGLVTDIDRFDATFFGISPREAELMDPQQRVFLEQAWRALEDAGHAVGPERRVNCGVFVGTAAGDYMQLLQAAGATDSGQVFLGNSASILAGRIAYFLNLEGPTVAVDTACSSSLVALHLACQSIRGGDCDMAVAGGIALMVTPQMHIWNSKSGMLSQLGRCASFDASADGFVLGEGAGLVVVKRLSAALADRDRIYAVIRASGINGDGKTNGITAPSADAQLALQRRVHAAAGVSPDDIAYIETHGAGTQLGDPIEMKALAGLMRGRRTTLPPCGVGSIKSNFGHTTLASGIAGLIKVTLALQHREIPPSLHFDTMNPNIELGDVPLEVVTTRRAWPVGPSGRRMGAVNSFGMSGTNAHFVLQEAPPEAARPDAGDLVDEGHLLLVSARTSPALRAQVEGLVADLERGAELSNVAYTLGVGRAVFRKRCAIVAGDAVQAIALLRGALAEGTLEGVHSAHCAAADEHAGFDRALDGAALTTLGGRFCSGQAGLDLSGFFGRRRGRRIALSGYPLGNQRFWVPDPAGAAPSVAVPGATGPIRALLENTVKETIDPDTEWVRDHCVQGQHWVPGAAIVYYSARTQRFRPVELSDVEWLTPARVAGRVALDIQGTVDDEGRYDIEMRIAGQPSFARARCVPQGAGRPWPRMAVDTLVAGYSLAIEHDVLYDRFARAGIAYGPSYRLITRVAHDAQGAVAWLRADSGRGMIQTLDAILQVVAVLEEGTALKLPRRIDTVRLNRSLDAVVTVVAQRVGDGCYDVTACDRDGHAVLEVSGFQLVTSPDGGSRLYEPRWRELSSGPAQPSGDRTYLPLHPGAHLALPGTVTGELVIDARALGEAEPARTLEAARALFARLCAPRPDGLRVTVLTAGAVAVDATAPVRPVQAALASIARSAAAERPGLRLQVIDLAHDSAASREDLPVRPDDLPGLVALRGGRWYGRVMRPVAHVTPHRLLGDGETCVIVGGAGGIGFALSKELARMHGAALGWIGRRPLDESIRARMREIEQLGGRVTYVSASLGDEAALADAVRVIRGRFGPISAAIHSAIVLDDATLDTMRPEQLASVLEPKVAGCVNLHRSLEGEPLDKFVLFSSVSSLLDSPGQGNYAAASAYLDTWGAELRRRCGTPVFVVNWGYWGSVGIVSGPRYQREMAARGVGSIGPADGFACLRMQLGAGLPQAMVMNADPGRFASFGLTLETAAAPSAATVVHSIQGNSMYTDGGKPSSDGALPHGAPATARAAAERYLAGVFARVLKCDADALDVNETFDTFGVDSLLGTDLLRALRQDLGELPSTLFYQKLTIAEVAAYLVEHKGDALAALTGAVAMSADDSGATTRDRAHAPRAAMPVPAATASRASVTAPADAVVLDYVRGVFGDVLKLEPDVLDPHETFESYGVDSLLGTDILRALKADFADLPSTLLYERLTIAEVAGYLRTERAAEVARRLAPGSGIVDDGGRTVVADAHGTDAGRFVPVDEPASVMPTAVAARPAQPVSRRDGDIAVIASVGRYPGAPDLDAFWDNLRDGRRSIVAVPAERWDADAYFDPTPQPHRSYGKWGGFIDGVDQFDPKFFGILPSQATAMDPQERLFLESCWDLLEQAGHNGSDTRETRTGVFVGIMYGSYGQIAAAAGWPQGQFNLGHSPYWSVANRVSYTFNFSGPSMAVDTACSSSLTAFHLACEAIRRGECRQAIAGGVNVILHPAHHIALSAMQMLGTGLACRTFDKSADGIVPGEGVGAVLLRPLEDALADGDEILAVVRGSMINAGGKTGGYTVPNVNAQADVIAEALARAGVAPDEIGVIEVHGTGTQLGDPIEIAALNRVYGGTGRPTPLLVGSVKSNIGHLEGAAGIAGLAKAILQLRNHAVAPCAGLDDLNEKIDFGAAVMPARTLQPLASPGDGRPVACGVSSFGAGGANAHVILQQWQDHRVPAQAAGEHAFLLSANSHAQLAAYARRVADWLQRHPDASLSRLCFTSQVGRRALPVRAVAMAASLDALQAALRAIADGDAAALVSPAAGQGALSLGGVAEELIALLIARRGLRQLGELWVNGHEIAWRRTWDAAPVRCEFPSVPFEYKRIWMTPPPGTTADARPAPSTARLTRLAAAHRIGGRALVPGAALLDLMLDRQGADAPRAVRAVRWLRQAVLEGDGIELPVSDDADGMLVRGQDGEIVARALAAERPSCASAPRDLAALWATHGVCSEGATLYERLRAGGFEYGPELRAVARFATTDDSVVGELDATLLVADTAFAVSVDAAMQLVALLSHEPAVPVSIDAVTQFGAPERARVMLAERTADAARFDLTLWDADGHVVLRLDGLRIAALPQSGNAGPEYLCAVECATPRPAAVMVAGTVLLSGGARADHAVIGDALRQRGWSVLHDDGAPLSGLDAVLVLLDDAGADPASALVAQLAGQRRLLERLKAGRDGRKVRLLVVGRSGDLVAGALAAATRTLAMEFPWLACSHLLIAPGALEQAEGVADELCAPAEQDMVRLDGDARLVRRLQPMPGDATAVAEVRPGAVYVVSGGAGALGRLFTAHLVARGPATAVVLGRAEATDELKAWMASLSVRGSHVVYARVDVGDADALADAVAEIVERHGPVRGVLHAAGVTDDALLLNKSDRAIARVLRPKVRGALALDAATADAPLDFFMLCSSLVAETGNIGQIDYAAANRFMIEFGAARERERAAGRRHGVTVSVAWPLWEAGGMRVDAATEALFRERFGMAALSTEAGLAAFEFALAGRHPGFALVQRYRAGTAGLAARSGDVAGPAANASVPAVTPRDETRASTAAPVAPVAAGAIAPASLRATILATLQQIGASYLFVDPAEVDPEGELLELGFDSISLTDMVNRINAQFGLDLLPTVLFECPTLGDVADYLGREHGARIAARLAPAPSTETVETASHRVGTAAAADGTALSPSPSRAAVLQPTDAATKPPHDEDGADRDAGAIAVIGMAGRLAGAASLDAFWDALERGASLTGAPPSDRTALLDDPVTRRVEGGFLADVARFDAVRFGISPREAALMDPQQRIVLETVLQAIEDAGYGQQRLGGRDVGLFVGASTSDYESMLTDAGVRVEPHVASGVAHSIIANRVSHLFDWHGPSEVVDTACSSALVAVHRAVAALRNGECEMAVAGGVNVTLSPGLFHAFIDSGMLSADFACKTFDRKANGYVRGEGVGAVVLKPLRRALAERDNVLAIVRGSAVNHGGKSNSLTAPNPAAQAQVIRRAIADAGVDPRRISFVETHGTGTPLGDPVETEGLKQGFALACDDAGVTVPASAWVALGAVKTTVGHLEAAAGIAGFLRTVLSMRHGRLAANRHFSELNPYIRLEGTPFMLLDRGRRWAAADGAPLLAGVSAFGFGGTNSHVILESAPAVVREPSAAAMLAFPLSAPDAGRLATYADALASALSTRDVALEDVAFTLRDGRDALAFRSVLVADSISELMGQLQALARGDVRDATRLDLLAAADRDAALEWLSTARTAWPEHGGRRCSLPAVPLAGERHWFAVPAIAPRGDAVTETVAPPTPPIAPPAARDAAVAAAPRTPVLLRPLSATPAPLPAISAASASAPQAGATRRGTPGVTDAGAPVAAAVSAPSIVDAIRLDLAEILLMTPEQVGLDARFDDLGLDSIFRMDLVRRVNERFATQLSGEALYNVESVAALAQLVEATRAAEGAAAPPAASAPALDSEPARDSAPARGIDASWIRDHVEALTGRQLGDQDDFSNAGLTSFDMLRVIAGLETTFGPLPKSSLFDYPTPRALASWLAATYGDDAALLLAASRPGPGATAHVPVRTERLADGAAVIAKRELSAHPDLAATVASLEAAWAKEGGLPGRDIAPLIFLGSGGSGYLNFSERDGLLLAWSSVVDEHRYAALAAEWVEWATSRNLRPNLLSMMPLPELAGVPFCATSFGTVQRLNDIASFSLNGKDMTRLRKKINRFERSGAVSVAEYVLGSEPATDRRIVELIDEWAARKDMVNPYVGTVRHEIGSGILAKRHRLFLTRVDSLIVAAIIVTKIPSENGYLLDLEFFGDAMGDGGLDYTIVTIIERLAQEGVQMFSFGATLGVVVADSPNPNSHVERTLGELRDSGIFRGDGNFQFKNKYRPDNLPVYLCQPAAASAVDVSSVLLLIVNPSVPPRDDAEPSAPPLVPDDAAAGIDAVTADRAPVTGESQRRARLREAGWNPLHLSPAAGIVELVTDSWAERDDFALAERVRVLTETANAICLDLADQRLLPFSYVQAAPSGRAAEMALLRAADGPRKGILQNHLFQTWTFNQLELGWVPHRLTTLPRSADIDLAHLDRMIERHRETIGLCCIELAPNATGGRAISLDNLRAVKARLAAVSIPLVFDATRGLENARMISVERDRPFWEVVAELFGLADVLTLSMSKDFGVNAGGLVASNHPAITRALEQRVRDRGHDVSMAGRRLLASALADRDWLEQAVAARVANVARVAASVAAAGIPVRAAGAHAVLIDAAAWCAGHAEPVASALAWLYDVTGVRAAPHLSAGLDETGQCIRLAVPVGLDDATLDALDAAFAASRAAAPPAELLRVPGGAGAAAQYVIRDSVPDDVVEALADAAPAAPAARNADVARRWQPAVRRHLVPYEGAQVEVFECGAGEPVVLLHPFNIGAGFFAPQFAELARTRRVVVVHAPGAGETTYGADLTFAGLSRLVLAAVQGIGITSRFVVAGASFGGLTALAVAHAYPERVGGLVLLGSSYKVGNRRGEVNRLAVVAREDFDALDRAGVTLDRPRGEYERLLAECESMDPKIGLRYLDVFAARPSLLDAARTLQVPALLIHGEHDTVIARSIAHEIDAAIPAARYVELDDAGHFPSLTSHARVNVLIDAFVDTVASRTPPAADPLEQGAYAID
ncbi:SDR family NAD(P)-dependent oxidoreductase [Burkholderia lata]|uniref:Polyketide synthase n=1 Tax=Burkholderia lata (strain ATCC 17760 / DSM 23089 / LMG 22485 / NCIMB 9086 / R18194 / 383) TaxID=482957 RepID=A0A6P2WYV3_BURL3|nr:SDR family NAD(P)-dependent oxidoreductase [Burkholderia lata]VWD01686.1 polyketide synthase [Burkholderia lata]